jgi:uncharacterized iron-regulated membrane protein
MSVLENETTRSLRIPKITRQFWVLMHRWVGLSILMFVFQVGLTGALLSFYDELDHLFLGTWATVEPQNVLLSEQEIIEKFQAVYPGITPNLPVDYADHPRDSLEIWLDPAEGELLGKQAFVDPYTGYVLGERIYGAIGFGGEDIMPMVYRLHYALLVQEWDGWGFWVMGVVTLLWTLDHIAALAISIPKSGPFWKAMTIKWRGSAYRINFDFHRAGGLSVMALTLMLALTGASWNATFFGTNVIHWLLDSLGGTTPYATENIAELPEPLATPKFSRLDAKAVTTMHLQTQGEEVHEWYISYSDAQGVYDVWASLNAYETRWWNGAFDASTGVLVAVRAPKDRTNVDVIKDWIYPLHSGHAFGLLGQIIICLTGIATAGFCVTGFVIWRKKWMARRQRRPVLRQKIS